MEKLGNKPAFARPAFFNQVGGAIPSQDGMTLREHYAGLAMQALIIGNNADSSVIIGAGNSIDAVQCADNLLKALEKK